VQTEHAARTSFLRQATVQATNEVILRRNAVVEELVTALQLSKAESERHLSALVDMKERLRLEADQRSHDKSTFLATAVHDLRQPIQAIGNALDPIGFALNQGRSTEAVELIDLAKKAVQVMRHQMSSILDVSRLESGLIKAKVVNVDLSELLRELADTFGPMASAKGAVLSLDHQATQPVCVRSDPHLLRRVLSNLLSNAIKYRDKNKRGAHCVDLILTAGEGQAGVQVVDNGIGIAQSSLDSGDIFKPFYQGQPAHRDGERGVGLGLAIVKAMISLLPSHDLHVSSELLEGSNFSLAMPLADEVCCLPASGTEAAHAEIDLDNLYVVLVEDDDLVRNATVAMLQARGVLVDATDSLEGLHVLVDEIERLPDVLLCDYRLSADRTALDAVQMMQDRLGPLNVVIFSGETIDFNRIEPLRHAQILRKPVSAEHVLAALSWARAQAAGQGAA
jgi:signal transduction histidine kinase/ActR/RegA family two-component response regulator